MFFAVFVSFWGEWSGKVAFPSTKQNWWPFTWKSAGSGRNRPNCRRPVAYGRRDNSRPKIFGSFSSFTPIWSETCWKHFRNQRSLINFSFFLYICVCFSFSRSGVFPRVLEAQGNHGGLSLGCAGVRGRRSMSSQYSTYTFHCFFFFFHPFPAILCRARTLFCPCLFFLLFFVQRVRHQRVVRLIHHSTTNELFQHRIRGMCTASTQLLLRISSWITSFFSSKLYRHFDGFCVQ